MNHQLHRSRIALSTASVYPESTARAFELGAQLGYDAIEVMVGIDPVSQDLATLRSLSSYHAMPVSAIHAPCLLITQRVWGTEPWGKLLRAAEVAVGLGAGTVVVHPPFRWQRDYAEGFEEGIQRLERDTGLAFAVENMFPWRAPRRQLQAYLPGWDPVGQGYLHCTVDLSHAATARSDPLAMAAALGDRMHHVHLADGTGSAKDEHLVPGRGGQPCAAFLEMLVATGYDGDVVVEINSRRAGSPEARILDLAESIAFAKLHLATPASA